MPQSSPETIAHKTHLLMNVSSRPFETLMTKLGVPADYQAKVAESLHEGARDIDCHTANDVFQLLFHGLLSSGVFERPRAEKRCQPFLMMGCVSLFYIWIVGVGFFVDHQEGTLQSSASLCMGIAAYAACVAIGVITTLIILDVLNAHLTCQESTDIIRILFCNRAYIYEKLGLAPPRESGKAARKSFASMLKASNNAMPEKKRVTGKPCYQLLPRM